MGKFDIGSFAQRRSFNYALLFAIGIISVLSYIYFRPPKETNAFLAVERTFRNGEPSTEWKNALQIVQWEREYTAGYLLPLVGFGAATLTLLYSRIKNPKVKAQTLWLKLAITALLLCAAFLTLGLDVRNEWVKQGVRATDGQIWRDRFVYNPGTS